MRVFISADMEGVAGVATAAQIDPAGRDHAMARQLMTREVNAAIEGALEAGVQEMVVSDGHQGCTNLVPEELHPRAELLSGHPRGLFMGAGIGPGYDAAFFVGYHAAAGTPDAVLDHTYASSRLVLEVRLNRRAQSEGTLNAYLCGYFDCPLALFTGDAAAVSQLHRSCLEVEAVVVKESLGRQVARSLHPETARRKIRSAARRAIERLPTIPAMRLDGRVELEVDFVQPAMADSAERVPGVLRVAPRTVSYAGGDYVEVYRLLLALVDLARAAA